MVERIKLGQEVKDRVTGFQGIVTSRTKFLNSCDRMAVQPKYNPEQGLKEPEVFDEPDLEIIGDGIYVAPEPKPKRNGGDPNFRPSRNLLR